MWVSQVIVKEALACLLIKVIAILFSTRHVQKVTLFLTRNIVSGLWRFTRTAVFAKIMLIDGIVVDLTDA